MEREKCASCGKKATNRNLKMPGMTTEYFCDICYNEFLKQKNNYLEGYIEALKYIINK